MGTLADVKKKALEMGPYAPLGNLERSTYTGDLRKMNEGGL
jgi:hypothetical protein